LTAQAGEDSKAFGFSPTAPPLEGAAFLTHLGPTDVTYLAAIGRGLALQAGIFNSLIGYDTLYAKDNLSYTRPWGADFTPYLMLGVNAQYPFTPRLTGTVAIINGYFHLAHANDVPNTAVQIAYKATDRVSLKQTVLAGSHQSDTALGSWRILSDTILERRSTRLVTAFEQQVGTERVDTDGQRRALWMSVQLPVHWVVRGPWSVTIRPEWTWDRDGRWIAGELGSGQSIAAISSSIEYRATHRQTTAIVRGEHRFDHSSGPGAGFFAQANTLMRRQHLWLVALIVSHDGSVR
jgi:hypothetical protein